VGLGRVWIETLDGGLVRADHVVEVLTHKTAPFAGKPAHWLVDVVTATSQGAGTAQHWNLGASHRTLIQTNHEPPGAARRLAQLLGALDTADAAGIVTARRSTADHAPGDAATVDFGFELFALPQGSSERLSESLSATASPEPQRLGPFL
jgi:hypothetical protein